MAISHIYTGGTSSGSTTGFDLAYAVGAGENRLMFLFVVHTGDAAISEARFGSQYFTEYGNITTHSGVTGKVYYLVAPDVTTDVIHIAFNASVTACSMWVSDFTGVDQSTPIGTPSTYYEPSTPSASSVYIGEATSDPDAATICFAMATDEANATAPTLAFSSEYDPLSFSFNYAGYYVGVHAAHRTPPLAASWEVGPDRSVVPFSIEVYPLIPAPPTARPRSQCVVIG